MFYLWFVLYLVFWYFIMERRGEEFLVLVRLILVVFFVGVFVFLFGIMLSVYVNFKF